MTASSSNRVNRRAMRATLPRHDGRADTHTICAQSHTVQWRESVRDTDADQDALGHPALVGLDDDAERPTRGCAWRAAVVAVGGRAPRRAQAHSVI